MLFFPARLRYKQQKSCLVTVKNTFFSFFLPLDFFVFFVVIAGFFLLSIYIYGGNGAVLYYKIEGAGAAYIFPQDATETVAVSGPLGVTTVALSGGKARITASPCVNKTCIAQGSLFAANNTGALVCLPNRVIVSTVSAQRSRAKIDGGAW